jgi:eukaryotic-like serine/threonine-protein kinase
VSLRILLIDDSADFRLLAGQYVASEWADATVEEWDPVMRGEIPESFAITAFDVILLDYQLGTGDGLEWLQRLRSRPSCPPIVFVTGAGGEMIAVRALKTGAFDYLRKHDLSRARLIEVLRSAANERMAKVIYAARPEALQALKDRPQVSDFAVDAYAPHAQQIAINGYRMIKRIGSGGMGTVYLAERLSDGVELVLKILDADLSNNNLFLRRFIQEYGIISKISDPGVARIYDQGFTEQHAYIAMEYFAGGDLRAKIFRGMTPAESLHVLAALAKALEVIHGAGIVHRDLKPDNILFRDDNSLALVDFGIAKVATNHTNITTFGEILGTPNYFSPEQASGKALDGRSDLYSAGILSFEMLTGARPFQAENAVTLAYKHVHEELPRLPPQLIGLQGLIDRLTAKNPNDRFADAGELRGYLAQHAQTLLDTVNDDVLCSNDAYDLTDDTVTIDRIGSDEALLDEIRFSHLRADLEGNFTLLGKVISTFSRGATTRAKDMARSLEAHDARSLLVQAHSLKGSAMMIGAARLAMLAEHVEERASSGSLRGLQPLIAEIAACVEETIEKLGSSVGAQK